MTRHLQLNHGILKTDSTPSDNTGNVENNAGVIKDSLKRKIHLLIAKKQDFENVENNTGYLFFHRLIIVSLIRKIHLLIA